MVNAPFLYGGKSEFKSQVVYLAFNIKMISQKNLMIIESETKEKINEFVDEFVYYLYWDEWMDWYWIWDVWSVVSIWDMYFGLEDMFIYTKYKPNEIHDIYRDYLDVSEKMSLSAFLKKKEWVVKEKEDVDLEKIEKDFIKSVEETVEEELRKNWIMITKFIKSKKTWNILYSRRPWDFQSEIDINWDVTTFIDQSLYYIRVGWQEWIDYERVNKPIKESIQLRCDDWKYKWISEMNNNEIAYQLSKKYCETLKNILRMA